MKSLLEQLLAQALRSLAGTLIPQMPEAGTWAVERTRDDAHGDYASNVAMKLAKATGKPAHEVARAIVAALSRNPLVRKVEVSPNGFINFFLAPAGLAHEIRRLHELGEAYARRSSGAEEPTRDEALSGPQQIALARYHVYKESLARVKAAAGKDIPPEDAAVLEPIVRGANVFRGKELVQLSSYQALRDEVGEDACRFFFLSRSHEQALEFDLQLATARRLDNPLFCVQYAHARVASAMKEVKARGLSFDLAAGLDKLDRLDRKTERTLIAMLLRFPEEVESAAANCAPHGIVYYLREVANAFHTYYAAEQWIVEEVDLRNARLALVLAAGQVLRNGLALIGVSAPESL